MAQGRNITLDWNGLPEFRRKLEALGPNAVHAAAGALYREAQRIITVSKVAFVPVDSGALRSSGFVKEPEIAGLSVTVILGFGGPAGTGNQGETNTVDVGYALPVHEIMGRYHPVGQAKYLEVPFRAALTGMDSRLAADVKRATR